LQSRKLFFIAPLPYIALLPLLACLFIAVVLAAQPWKWFLWMPLTAVLAASLAMPVPTGTEIIA
jgi:hypothetical protein